MKISIYTREKSNLSLDESAQIVANYMNKFASFFQRKDWFLSRRKNIDVFDCENAQKTILNVFTADLRPYHSKKELVPEFVSSISSMITIYSTLKYEVDYNFNFSIGGERRTKGYIYIAPFELIPNFQDKNSVISFISFIVNEIDVKYVEVFDRDFSLDILQNHPIKEFSIGWLLYVNNEYDVTNFPINCEIIPISKGHIIIFTEEIFDVNNPEHCERAKFVTEKLREHNFYRID